ncbi:MAG: hypothetical protein H0U88_09685 [Chthoniobacterales bacterium]|nr:hypothetical protein [Chthoniobacterales bacterium]
MDKSEIRAVLSVYRPGDPETEDPRLQQAKAAAAADPELAQWWAEHQEFDRIISSKLQSGEVPAGLRSRLSAWEKRTVQRSNWNRGFLLAAASIIALAVLFGSWRGPFQPAPSLAEYRDELVSFVKLDPPLELRSSEIVRLTEFLQKNGAPSQLDIPRGLRRLDPAGCRTLRFRGQDVALICFKREDGELVHLFAVKRGALPRLGLKRETPEFAAQGDWMTAAWGGDDYAYLVAGKGDRASLEKYFGTS